MPPFVSSMASQPEKNFNFSNGIKPHSEIITIDVGGQIFQTTKQTLSLAGSNSLFHRLAESTQLGLRFIDRDPELFSVLLSLLRTGNLPSKAKAFDIEDLIAESKFYNVESVLIKYLSNSYQFDALDLEKSLSLPLNGRDFSSTIATSPIGTLHVAHGSKITSFDWSLRRKSTILTQFNAIDSLVAISPNLAAAGATDFSGMQILDLGKGFIRETLCWENVTRSGSTVQAIGSNQEYLFTSFESGRRNSNSIMVYDLQTFSPVTEIAHCEIYGADLDSAIPATKLKWVESYNMLMASGSHSGPSGMLGNVRLWDIRSGNIIWELKERVDCFSDITVSDSLSAIFKVGVNSGEVFWTDLRKLTDGESSNPWTCLGDSRKVLNVKKEGVGCKIEANGNQLFCSKGGDVKVLSEVPMSFSKKPGNELPDRVFRPNSIGRVKDMGGSRITNFAFGGNKMFLTRKDQQSVEVWQSSDGHF